MTQVWFLNVFNKNLSYQWFSFNYDEELNKAKEFIRQEIPLIQFDENNFYEQREYYIYELLLDKYDQDQISKPYSQTV